MKIIKSLCNIIGLLVLIGAASPASNGDVPSAIVAVILGVAILAIGSVLKE